MHLATTLLAKVTHVQCLKLEVRLDLYAWVKWSTDELGAK